MMSNFKLDKVNVIDIEATCYENGVFPEDEIQEIIEIGVAVVHLDKLKIVEKESILIKPVYSSVSRYCTGLTGHTLENLNKHGIDFPAACAVLREKYNSRNRLWISQGNWDRLIIKRMCKLFRTKYPFSYNHMNNATLFSLMTGYRRQIGLTKQLAKLGIDHAGSHHLGIDDACSEANVLIQILQRGRFKL